MQMKSSILDIVEVAALSVWIKESSFNFDDINASGSCGFVNKLFGALLVFFIKMTEISKGFVGPLAK